MFNLLYKFKGGTFDDPRANLVERENDTFIGGQKERTMQTIKVQDENIQVLDQAVDRLGHMADGINQELKVQ